MKAGQLARILQSIDPLSEVCFTVGCDIDDRREIIRAATGDIDILADIDNISVDISELAIKGIRVDINLHPDMRFYVKDEQV